MFHKCFNKTNHIDNQNSGEGNFINPISRLKWECSQKSYIAGMRIGLWDQIEALERKTSSHHHHTNDTMTRNLSFHAFQNFFIKVFTKISFFPAEILILEIFKYKNSKRTRLKKFRIQNLSVINLGTMQTD